SGPNAASGALVRGVRGADLRRLPEVAGNILSGSLDGFDGSQKVVVGRRLAESLGLTVGDKITLVSPRGTATPFGVTPRSKAYEIAALFEIGMSEYDSIFVFMPFAEEQVYFNQEGAATGIDVFLEDAYAVQALRPAI